MVGSDREDRRGLPEGERRVIIHGSRQTLLPGLEGGFEEERSFARKQRSGRDDGSAGFMSQATLNSADGAMSPEK
jgi:hypothetical protein